jgi:hypothetical protein
VSFALFVVSVPFLLGLSDTEKLAAIPLAAIPAIAALLHREKGSPRGVKRALRLFFSIGFIVVFALAVSIPQVRDYVAEETSPVFDVIHDSVHVMYVLGESIVDHLIGSDTEEVSQDEPEIEPQPELSIDVPGIGR